MKLDSLEKQVLEHARRQMAPTPADALRVREAALAKIGATVGTSSATGAWVALSKVKLALLAASIAGLTGATIFALRSPETSMPPEPHAVSAVDQKTAHPAQLPLPRDESSVPAVPTTALDSAEVTARVTVQSPHTYRSSPAGSQARPASLAANPSPSKGLAEEVRLLEQADHALRNGNPELARRSLEQLATRQPNGRLQEERAATETLIRCQELDPGASRAAAERFLKSHPRSVYAVRVRAACTGFRPAD